MMDTSSTHTSPAPDRTASSAVVLAAAIYYADSVVGERSVGVVGYCYGGTLACLAATRWNPSGQLAITAGRLLNSSTNNRSRPVMLHFGEKDMHIS